ncbi:DUF3872 domain-containing protein (plasmid) [Elizabethkingia anophelis]|uniref:TraQ conjugal transfer family protein n=1 Tax=Elizabethkingia anophelis TaxID=1117645 RepID=UPI0020B78CCB|nr:TraQ conjugal transfer family protein [Elizabethkingia anophelis]UTG66783.1 DUF3872 domain-containing protein [Elizabethkingia anophelis]
MKKTIFIILTTISLFIFNSCRSDGDWGDNQTNGQFGFKVERDKDFQEKAVGETTDLKFNIKANYDFATVPMKIKYTGDLDGVLKLGDIVLEQNKEYDLKNPDNILKYTGNVNGTHKLKISVKNSKDQSQTEEFELKYAVSDFQVNLTGGNSNQNYQGQDIIYTGKITPAKNTDTKGYIIKFNTYSAGTIKFNGVAAELGKEYPINDISSFTVTTNSTKSGSQNMGYTIKNSTVSRDFEIQQNILARTIAFDNEPTISKTLLSVNEDLSIIGIVKKNPSDNSTIFYKTWISSATNGATDGISTTNGIYQQYALGVNNQLKIDMKTVKTGDFTINVQLKDEFGNESDVKQFQVKVDNKITINSSSVNVSLRRTATMLSVGSFDIRHYYDGSQISINANTGVGNKINKVVVELNYIYDGNTISKSYTYDYKDLPSEINMNNQNTGDQEQLRSKIENSISKSPINASNGTYKVYVYDTNGKVETKEGTTIVNVYGN